MPNTQQRSLTFESLDGVVNEARRLHEHGYHATGKWNLGQTCFHLVEWARFPMDGFPQPPLVLRAIFGGMRGLGIIDRMTKNILANGFKAGTPTAPQTVAKPDAMSDADGVDQLTAVIDRMKSFEGALHPSPMFGEMDRELWIKVTLLHCQHHLSFLIPTQASAAARHATDGHATEDSGKVEAYTRTARNY